LIRFSIVSAGGLQWYTKMALGRIEAGLEELATSYFILAWWCQLTLRIRALRVRTIRAKIWLLVNRSPALWPWKVLK